MKIYNIEITETLQRVIKIKAESLDDAITKAHNQYNNGEVVLDSNYYIDTNIKAIDFED